MRSGQRKSSQYNDRPPKLVKGHLPSATLLLMIFVLPLSCFGEAEPTAENVGGWPALKARPVDCRYEIDLTVSPPAEQGLPPKAAVRQRLLFRNMAEVPLGELEMLGPRPAAVRLAPEQSLPTSEPGKDGVWKISLPQALEPGKWVDVSIDFEVTCSRDVYRFEEFWQLSGRWHPKVIDANASSDAEGPNPAIASYGIVARVQAAWMCAASGQKLRETLEAETRTIEFSADHIADCALIFTETLTATRRSAAGVEIEVLYRPEGKAQAEQMADMAKDVVEFYSEQLGFYPHPYLCVVMLGQGFGGGPIGGNIVRVNDSIDRSVDQTYWGVAHEIGHEYWGFECVVDSDLVPKWFGLGMGLHFDQAYCQSRNLNVSQHSIIKANYFQSAKGRRGTMLITVPLSERTDLAHSKGFHIIDMLEYLLGKEKFDGAVREFLTTYRYRRIPQDAIQAVFQKYAQDDLSDFFHGWLMTSETLDYGVEHVSSNQVEGKFQIEVKLQHLGKIEMPMPVEVKLVDGKTLRQRSRLGSDVVQFEAGSDWYSVVIDPDVVLPELDRSNNAARNPDAPAVFQISDVHLGDLAWGRNILRAKVRNVSDREEKLWLHIGGRYQESSHPQGFGMGMSEPLVFKPGEERVIEHPYWVPPQPGKLTGKIRFVIPSGSANPYDQDPFMLKEYSVTFETPNPRCNELTPTYSYDGPSIPAFSYVETERFVFYFFPGTPAHRDIEKIKTDREKALAEICSFLGASPREKVSCFFYPDPAQKRECTLHQGDGLAFDNTIVEVYNDATKLDPYHELTHVVAREVGNPPALLSEGLAAYMQVGHQWKGADVDATAATLRREGKLVPITELLKRTEIGSQRDDGEVAYPESASFVKFVVDNYGRDRLLELYRQLENGGDEATLSRNTSSVKEILGDELAAVQARWEKALDARSQ